MKWDVKKINEAGWQEQSLGAIIPEAGNSRYYRTGGWRTVRPILDRERCNDCLLCWIYCPDSAVKVREGKLLGFDLDFCKGCGICAESCARQAITMKDEVSCQEAEARCQK